MMESGSMQRNLLKKIVSVFILGFGVIYAVNAQNDDGRNSDGARGSSRRSSSAVENVDSITIYNETGFRIMEIYIYKAGNTDWGEDLLPIIRKDFLTKGNVTINLDNSYDKSALYTIRLRDIGKDYYTKNNVSLTGLKEVTIGIKDLEY
jgi:hypothetical protein